LPERQRAEVAAYYASNNFADCALSLYRQWSNLLAQAAAVKTLGDMPLVVIVGGASENAIGTARDLQDELAGLSTHGRVVMVDGATHASLVHNKEHAQAVAHEITALVEQVRKEDADQAPQAVTQ
jgi:hypothetical protein